MWVVLYIIIPEFLFNFSVQLPMFEMTMYTVSENDRLVPLCIVVGARDSVNQTYSITAQQNSPPKAEGKNIYPHNIILERCINVCIKLASFIINLSVNSVKEVRIIIVVLY